MFFEDLIKYLNNTGREELAETLSVKIKRLLLDTKVLTSKQLQKLSAQQIPLICAYYNIMLQMQYATLNIITQQQQKQARFFQIVE